MPRILISILWTLTLMCVVILITPARAQEPYQPREWDLGNFEQAGQVTLYDGPQAASSTGKPVELGDYNGNGCGDVAITGQNARGGNGQTRIVFDICERWGQSIDLFVPDDNRPLMVNVFGAIAGDMLGTELYHGDFNGDGFDDLVIGAQNADIPAFNLADAGAAYIIFGQPDLGWQPTIDMTNPPDFVMTIHGGNSGDRAGIWVEGGDFDGDGLDDLLIGANQADGLMEGTRRSNAGEVYVIYGSKRMFSDYGTSINLGDPSDTITRIIGRDGDDLLGSTVYGGDLNADGIDDVIASAALWRGSAGIGGLAQGGSSSRANERYRGGETVVVFGGEDLRGKTIDLMPLIDDDGAPVNDSVAVVYGAEANDFMGEEIITGDLNGDGWNDLVVGSLAAPGRDNARPDGGEAWIIYVDETFAGSMVDLAEEGAAVPVYAPEPDNKGGDTMLIADMDQDGIGDLLYGMPNLDVQLEDGSTRINAGALAIMYSTPNGFPTTDGIIDFADPPADLRYDLWLGADPHDMSSYGMSLMDVNGDGYPDVALNGMGGDGRDNRYPDAGEIYIINGQTFADYQGGVIASAPAGTPFPTPTPPPQLTDEQIAALPELSHEEGEALFLHNCAGCHGMDANGLEGLGVSLVESDYTNPDVLSDAELLLFIRIGRSGDASTSKIGRAMPPSGGNPNLTDAELLAIIHFIRSQRE